MAVLFALAPFAMETRYPAPAPPAVQKEGLTFAYATLERLRPTPFGTSARGKALMGEAYRLVNGKRILFSAELGESRGQTILRLFGRRRIYLKVLQAPNDVYIHQHDWQLAEALIHETLHALQGGLRAASFEEECDAFAAGLQAEAVIRKIEPAIPLTMDGRPVADFVRRRYPRINSQPAYRPVGITREELAALAGF